MPNLKGFQVRVSETVKQEFRDRYTAGESWKTLVAEFPGSPSAFWLVVRGLRTEKMQSQQMLSNARLQTLSDAQRGWIAGIFDGEGWIGLTKARKANSYLPRITVASTTRCMQERLVELLGGNVYRRKATTENCRDTFVWQVWSSCNVEPILRAVFDHLVVKRNVASVLIQFCERHLFEFRGVVSHQDVLAYNKIRKLNRRGTNG